MSEDIITSLIENYEELNRLRGWLYHIYKTHGVDGEDHAARALQGEPAPEEVTP